MSESMGSRVKEFVINHWVSWVIELGILSLVAYFTIAETRKTAEQTREILAKYDAVISKYALEKTKAVDEVTTAGVETVKEHVKTVDVKGFLRSLKKDKEMKKDDQQRD